MNFLNQWLIVLVLFCFGFSLQITPDRAVELKKKVNDVIQEWALFYSGKPVNCIHGQFLFAGSAVVESSNYTIRGVGPIYRHCEAYLQNQFNEVEIFITSPIFYGHWESEDHLRVSFSNTNLYVTQTLCRVSVHGTTNMVFKVVNDTRDPKQEMVLISEWLDLYDKAEFDAQMQMCSFPAIDFEQIKKEAEKSFATHKKDEL